MKIFYSHHQWKYGTKIEQYELDLIKSAYPGADIFNAATDIAQDQNEEVIMRECLKNVKESQILIYSSVDGCIGKGAYREMQCALEHGIPILYLFHNKLLPRSNKGRNVVKLDNPVSDRIYAKVFENGQCL